MFRFRRMPPPFFVVALLSLALVPGCSCSEEEPGPSPDAGPVAQGEVYVSGRVVDQNESPLAGAAVRVSGRSAQSDSAGRFALFAAVETSAVLRVEAAGFLSAQRLLARGPGSRAWAGVVMLVPGGARREIGAAGGTVGDLASGLSVEVPAGAFSTPVTLEAGLVPVGDPLLDRLRLPAPLPRPDNAVLAPLFAASISAGGARRDGPSARA